MSTPSFGGWLSITWFFAPHADVRLDGIRQRIAHPGGATDVAMFLAQIHLYL